MRRVKNVALTLIAIVIALLLGEVAVRAYTSIRSGYLSADFVRVLQDRVSSYPISYDSQFGWIPTPNTTFKDPKSNETYTNLEDGIRSNGTQKTLPQHGGRKILAVGDSFTYGDGVSDAETWPAQLEQRLGVPVINGGVPAFGFDQTVLRAEYLVKKYRPSMLVVGFIPDDIRRCEASERNWVAKPYFVVRNDELELRNSPVPAPKASFQRILLKPLLTHSQLASFVSTRLVPEYSSNRIHRKMHGDGLEVTCRLILGLKERLPGVQIAMVRQAAPGELRAKELVWVNEITDRCIQQAGLKYIDLVDDLRDLAAANPNRFASLYKGAHMNKMGNEFTAEKIEEYLRR